MGLFRIKDQIKSSMSTLGVCRDMEGSKITQLVADIVISHLYLVLGRLLGLFHEPMSWSTPSLLPSLLPS